MMQTGARAGFTGIVLAVSVQAATLSMVTISGFPNYMSPLSPGSTLSCDDAGAASAGCSIEFHGGYYRSNGLATAGASSAFGEVSGSASAWTDQSSILAHFSAQFSDYVEVTGGSGSGVLVAHYESSVYVPPIDPYYPEQADCGLGLPFPFFAINPTAPLFEAQVGSSRQEWSIGSTGGSSVDITAPFVFGQPTPVRGSVSATSSCTSGNLSLGSFSVYDAEGNLVSAAQVIPQGRPDLDSFIPEPGTSLLVLAGLVLIAPAAAQTRRKA